jgi:RNA polymerase sigma factor (sigma-70 family)
MRFGHRWPHLADEFASEAGLALCEAARHFQESRGVLFATFADRVVRKALFSILRTRPGGKRCSAAKARLLDAQPLHEVRGRGGEFLEIADPSRPVGWETEVRDHVDRLLQELPARHREVMRLLISDGAALPSTVAVHVGLTPGRVRQIRAESVAMLRDWFGDSSA